MRKVVIESWKAKIANGTEVDESLISVLNVLLNNKKPESLPRGLDKFRLYNRLSKAFEKAEKVNILELEESDYDFLKKTLEEDIPSVWGANINIVNAVESFINAQKE